jgi:hypothetical protein
MTRKGSRAACEPLADICQDILEARQRGLCKGPRGSAERKFFGYQGNAEL